MRLTRGLALSTSVALAAAGCVNSQTQSLKESLPSVVSTMTDTPSVSAPQDLPSKESAALCLNMAESLEKENKETDALIYYERARQLDPSLNDRAARRLAVLYDRHDQQAKGMTEFQQLLQKYPKDSSLLNDVGYSYYNRGQWNEAETFLRRATTADKTNKRAWNNLGMTLAQQGRTDEAFAAFTRIMSPAEAHANLGFLLAQHPERRAEAIQSYRQALTLEPTLTVAQKALQRLEAPTPASASATTTTPVSLPTGS